MVLRSDGGTKWYLIYELLVWRTGMWHVMQDHKRWFNLCEIAVNEVTQCRGRNTCAANRASQERSIPCICGRCFRQKGDLTRHHRFCDLYSLSLAQNSS